MAITDAKIKAARSTDKEQTLNDGEGLYLVISPNGRKWWRFRYQMNGKRTMLSLGTYPYVTLSARMQLSPWKHLSVRGLILF